MKNNLFPVMSLAALKEVGRVYLICMWHLYVEVPKGGINRNVIMDWSLVVLLGNSSVNYFGKGRR